jgi:hypothetical protein
VRAHVDQGHLVEASRIIDLYADLPSMISASLEVPRALLAARRDDADAALAIVARFREERPGQLDRDVLDAAAVAADVHLMSGDADAALEELSCVLDFPASTWRGCASARRARALVALGRLDEARDLLDEVAGEVLPDQPAPSTLTYLLVRAMISEEPARSEALTRYDELVSGSPVIPWPRDAADRASSGA